MAEAVKKPKGKIEINAELCKGCGRCIEACNFKLISLGAPLNQQGHHAAVFNDPECKCGGCKLCAIVCPDVAITVYKEDGK
jgi:2-oxoglutarate ferredoxin oxidoreductase subunit delta